VRIHQIPVEDVWTVGNPVKAAVGAIWNGGAATQLSEFLKDFSPEETVVHFHQWTKAFSPSVIARAIRDGFRVAVTLHDYFFACPNGALYNYKSGAPCALRPMSVGCITSNCDARSPVHKAIRLIRSGVQRMMFRTLDARPAFIHVSSFARRTIQPLLAPDTRHYTVENPVIMAQSSRAAVEENAEFLFIGRLVPQKGCVELARAARKAGVSIAFAGAGPCEAAIREANPAARMLGWLPAAEIVPLLRRSRALAFPSRWYETSGLVCIEALANGVPVLVSNRTAAAELVQDGVTGFTFDPDDEPALELALRTLLDPDVAGRMSAAAFGRYWAAPLGLERHVEGLLSTYQDLLRQSAAPDLPALNSIVLAPGMPDA